METAQNNSKTCLSALQELAHWDPSVTEELEGISKARRMGLFFARPHTLGLLSEVHCFPNFGLNL